jgi:AcrR family transcriptional regulator
VDKVATAQRKPRRTRLNAKLRQEQILEEATRSIAQSGYHGFSIQEVAERCRITNAGLLYYFGSKDQLLIALLQHRVSRDTAALAWC